jgi:hypothetical protein
LYRLLHAASAILAASEATMKRFLELPFLFRVVAGLELLYAAFAGRTDHQVSWLTDQIRSTAVTAVPAEVSRMQRVRRSFQMALAFEGFVIAAGVVLALASRSTPHLFAAGLGCIGAGALLLTFDLIADRRAALYLAHMVSWTKGLYGS